MAFPETLAFMYKSDRLLKSSSENIKIVHLDKNDGLGNLIREEVKEFSEKLSSEGVVKVTNHCLCFVRPKVMRRL